MTRMLWSTDRADEGKLLHQCREAGPHSTAPGGGAGGGRCVLIK